MYIALGIGECHKCPRSIFVLMLVGTIWTVSQRSSNQTPTLFIVLPDLKYTLQNVLAVSDSDYMIQTHPLSLFLPLAMWMPGKEGSWTSKINKNVFSSLVSHPNLPPPNLLLDPWIRKKKPNWFNRLLFSLLTFTKLLIRSKTSKQSCRKKKETQQGA